MKAKSLHIINARENNLKNIDLEIPHDTFTVVTGLSGSGKSSLAFDTVYAEGQRRYIETFSPYTRQFFDKVKKPAVDNIENVRPAVAIEQRTRILTSRSTVGTLTNILDYLKILWSNVAQAMCPVCDIPLRRWTPDSLAKHLISFFELKKERGFLLATRVKILSKSLKGELLRLSTLGFSRIYIEQTGALTTVDEIDVDDLKGASSIILVLDRVTNKIPQHSRLRDSIDQAFSLSGGSFILIEQSDRKDSSYLRVINSPSQKNEHKHANEIIEFNDNFCCNYENVKIERVKPSLFSHNHPVGACPECKGFGRILVIDRARCVPNQNLSIEEKAVNCWSGDASQGEFRRLIKFCKEKKIPTDVPWKKLSATAQEEIFTHKSKLFRGVLHWFKRLERKAYKMHVRVFLSRYRMQMVCPLCNGTRLKAASLAYQVEGLRFPDLMSMSIGKLLSWLKDFMQRYSRGKSLPREMQYCFDSVISRLECLSKLGLSYLTLDRQARTLSGGETQRVNLATAIGSELISTQFVLDEPSVGLHSRDSKNLLDTLHALRERNNSLLVVEHDLECIGSADNVIELGPKAGTQGGEIIYSGPIQKWRGLNFDKSVLLNDKIESPAKDFLEVENACVRNLKNISLKIPLGRLVCLSGVSGSGKSSLAKEAIMNAYDNFKNGQSITDGQNIVSGFDKFEQVLLVDQSPLSKTPRANLATYSKIWEEVRTLLANTDEAKLRKLSKSSFSFNVDGGRCPHCKGAGYITEDMQFLSDVYVPCEVCLGKRFQESVLEVKYKGKSVFELLQLSVDDCTRFFHGHQNIRETAEILCQLGLGHLSVGHPLSALSGGEAQRLKLVPLLCEAQKASSFLVFDEPTTGLHVEDVQNLIGLFRTLCKSGHSILCIEHNLGMLLASDWIIDLGPEGGDEGGFLVCEGRPEDLIKGSDKLIKKSYTKDALIDFEKSLNSKSTSIKPAKISKSKVRDNSEFLTIVGAKEHNLKNIDVKIPLYRMVALTGVSGSGKSSIAKDIVYAEGQRRFLDCLSPYARQFIKELKRPEIDHIDNVQPTVCVYQHTFQPSKLSTVATMSEVYNFLRLLYAKVGTQYCPDHPKQQISPLSAEEIANEIATYRVPNLRILAPIVKLKKGHHNEIFNRAIDSEITEVRVDGLFGAPSKFINALDKKKPHSIEYVIGKLNPAQVAKDMLVDALNQAFSLSAGTVIIHTTQKEEIFSTQRTCAVCHRGFFKIDPEDLSFNSKRGVCLSCSGAGIDSKGRVCSTCGGARLNEIGRNIRLDQNNIHDACMQNAKHLLQFLNSIKLDATKKKVAESILLELKTRLSGLIETGIDYLLLDRGCSTLSSGELQRLRLATAMGSTLTGVMYIFDEPSSGLHPIDNMKVLNRLRESCSQGNSVIVIEHDANSILACDDVIDIGPGGGTNGGEVVYAGSVSDFSSSKISKTAEAIFHKDLIHKNSPSRIKKSKHPLLKIKKANKNNVELKEQDIPLQALVVFAGVSGAGKSSLVHGIISDTINLGRIKDNKFDWNENILQSDIALERAVYIDQKPIGLNSRSTPASYLKIWDQIRTVFANTIEAKSRGWGPSHFSYNTGKGRCPECKGQGQIKLEMNFLPDATMLCEACRGSRYLDETNTVHYLGLSISDVLNLTFEEAKTIFAQHRKIHQAITLVCEIGLGYLTLGQASPTLSGGECQRIKLVSELSSPRKGHTLYILDEPTTGLHKLDVYKLNKILRDLVDKGNTVYVIEHDEDVLKNADYILELGPGPGELGGKIIFEGTAEELVKINTPWGRILRAGGIVEHAANFSNAEVVGTV